MVVVVVVQVLSMSRLGGAAAVAPLVADMSSEVRFISSTNLKQDAIWLVVVQSLSVKRRRSFNPFLVS